jgi:hypothetical protein
MLVLYTIYKKETVWSFCFHLLSLTKYSFIHIEVQELFHITVEELFLTMASTSRNEKKGNGAKYIPEVIAFSILSKLPLKSLKRFSCASKSWTHLFENPDFITMFHKNFLSKSHSLYKDDDDDVHFVLHQYVGSFRLDFYILDGEKFENKHKLDLPSSFHIRVIRILGSAMNGVFCIYDSDDHTTAALWNPATSNVKVLPPGSAEYQG